MSESQEISPVFQYEDDVEYGLFAAEPNIFEPGLIWIGDESGAFVLVKSEQDSGNAMERCERIAAALTVCRDLDGEDLIDAAFGKAKIELDSVASKPDSDVTLLKAQIPADESSECPVFISIGDDSATFVSVRLQPDFEDEDLERCVRITAVLNLCRDISDADLLEAASRKIKAQLLNIKSYQPNVIEVNRG